MIANLRRELFDRLLIVSARHLRQVLTEYLLHYHRPATARSQAARAGSSSYLATGVLGGLTYEYQVAA